MFRTVILLPKNVPGQLYLHSMPGRYEAWGDFVAEARRCNIHLIVCLVPNDEIEKKSPSYADVIRSGALSYPIEFFPIPDYKVPQNREEYATFVMRIAQLLRSRHTILVHCGAGIGRTGTFAVCLLLAFGLNRIEAEKAICVAGSYPETDEQIELVGWCEKKLRTA